MAEFSQDGAYDELALGWLRKGRGGLKRASVGVLVGLGSGGASFAGWLWGVGSFGLR